MTKIEIVRELRDLAEGVIDPTVAASEGLLGKFEQGAIDAARSLPYTAVAVVPVAGLPLVFTAIAGSEYDHYRRAYPDLDPEVAALFSAGLQAAMEWFAGKALIGKFPMMEGVLSKVRAVLDRNYRNGRGEKARLQGRGTGLGLDDPGPCR